MSDIAILVPVLRRPHLVAPLLESIRAATPEPHRVVFICDPDDLDQQRAVPRGAGVDLMIVNGGYAAKINAAARVASEPLLFLGADDLRFHSGWLTAACVLMTDGIGVVGTNDLGNPRVIEGRHATHSVVSREYAALGTIDGQGVLHEGYGHCFCDDELVATARYRRAFAFAADSRVEHLHPNWKPNVPDDATYRRGQSTLREDRRLFRSRRNLWRTTLDATVVVATYGAPEWRRLARQRAIPSARREDVPVVHVHADSLHDARNQGLARVETEWVVHLDADDELERGYLDAMAASLADLRAPAVRYLHPQRGESPPSVPVVVGHAHECTTACLDTGNWMVIGTAARAEMVRDVGGWRDWPMYEDFDLWLRCVRLAGATAEAVPDAVYRAHVRRGSRNRAPRARRVAIRDAILAASTLEAAVA